MPAGTYNACNRRRTGARSVAIFVAAVAALISGTSREALASAGCAAWNALGSIAGPQTNNDVSASWTAGDTIHISEPVGVGGIENIRRNGVVILTANNNGGLIS